MYVLWFLGGVMFSIFHRGSCSPIVPQSKWRGVPPLLCPSTNLPWHSTAGSWQDLHSDLSKNKNREKGSSKHCNRRFLQATFFCIHRIVYNYTGQGHTHSVSALLLVSVFTGSCMTTRDRDSWPGTTSTWFPDKKASSLSWAIILTVRYETRS